MNMREIMQLLESVELDEGGSRISRVTQHIRDGVPFFMISAMRANLPRSVNLRRTERLKAILAQLPVSFIETEGEYHEEGQAEPSKELSFFVMPKRGDRKSSPNSFRHIGIHLMNKFDQDSILLGDGDQIRLLMNDGSDFSIGDTATFRPEVIDHLEGYSLLKGRKFSFTDAPTAAEPVKAHGTPAKTHGVRYGGEKPRTPSIKDALDKIA